MTVRNVKKNLAGQQDLLPGVGPYTQTRRGETMVMHGPARSYFDLFVRSYAEVGLLVKGTFEDGCTLVTVDDIAIHLAEGLGYSYSGTLSRVIVAGENPNSNPLWTVRSADSFREQIAGPQGSSYVGFQQAGTGSVPRTAQDKMREILSVKDKGALGDGVTNDSAAFDIIDAGGVSAWVPEGDYVIDHLPTGKYYGPGRLLLGIETLYLDQSIPTGLNTGVPTPIDPENPAQLARYMNLVVGQQAGLAMNHPDARANTIFGFEAMQDCVIPARATGYGKQVFKNALSLYSVDAFGADAMGQGDLYSRCAAFGANTLKWSGSPDPVLVLHDYYRNTGTGDGDFLTEIGLNAPNRWPTIRADYVGAINAPNPARIAISDEQNSQSVAVGRNALLHSLKTDGNTAVGVNALAHALDNSNNTAIGVRAGRDTVSGNQNTFVGASAGMQNISGTDNVAVGYSALLVGSHTYGNVAIGYRAAASLTGTDVAPAVTPTARRNVYLGAQAGENSTDGAFNVGIGSTSLRATKGSNNVAVGPATLMANSTGSSNTAIGSNSLLANTSGASNTAVGFESLLTSTTGVQSTACGYQAGRFDTLGASANFNNVSMFGYRAQVSGDNQVQLGNSATTTYVYGTVQNRSDERDKTDIRNTELGIEFIMGLRPVDGRWDMRDDYFEEYQVQVGIDENAVPVFETRTRQLPKDGSRARQRKHHWFIAQEVKELCDSLGVEFGGYQDHSINDGCDVLSLGYDEFIPPTVKAVQQCWTRLDELEKRIAALE